MSTTIPTTIPKKQASVVLVGCGCPLRSMGWYHAVQLLEGRCPSARLKYIVEPFYMNPSLANTSTPGYQEFHNWRRTLEQETPVQFFETVSQVPLPTNTNTNNNDTNNSNSNSDERWLGIISARTADNPKLLQGCIDIGCSSIYLEKPGAPSVLELEQMRDSAKAANVSVFMGFNKNVSAYLTRTFDFCNQPPHDNSNNNQNRKDVTFVHNNSYQRNERELAECFERNSEGMLKNMAIHELAILVTYYGVTVDTIASVVADKEYSSCQTLKGPSSGRNFTDFDKLKFKIVTLNGTHVQVAADRCGGDDSVGMVQDSITQQTLATFSMPDEETIAHIPTLEQTYPGAMPYFFTQDPDYLSLKEKVAKHCVDGTSPDGVATIDVACDTLKVAEYLTPLLQNQLLP